MKRISIYALSLLMSGAFFVACEKDDNPELTLDKYDVEVEVGKEVVVKVIDGVSPFEAKSENDDVAKAKMSGKEITIEGVKEGSTTVKVTDKEGSQKSIKVTVKADPYAGYKADTTVRVDWGEFKVKGADAAVFTLIKDEEKNAVFTYENEEGTTLVVSLMDPEDKIGGTAEEPETKMATREDADKPVGEVTVTEKDKEPVTYDVTTWDVIQAQPTEEGAEDTYWVVFTANKEEGIIVSPLTVEETE